MDLSRILIRYVKKLIGGRNVSGKFLPEEQEDLRWECNEKKLSDAESAKVCEISVSAYSSWRKKRGLPIYKSKRNTNRKGQANQRKDNKIINELKNRVVLTAEDVAKYRHNDNNEKHTTNKVILQVDINPTLDLPEPKMKLADSPRGSYAGVVIGSKWDKNRELIVTAKQDTYANTVKMLVRNG